MNETSSQPKKVSMWVIRILAVLVLVGAGGGGFLWLKSMRQPPPRTVPKRIVPEVDVIRVTANPETMMLSGYGTVQPRMLTAVNSEISGKVMEVHPNLDEGRQLQKGEEICRLNSRDYELVKDLREADGDRLQAEIAVLRKEIANTRKTLELRREMEDLNRKEWKRAETLAAADIDPKTALEQARTALLRSREQVLALENQLAQLPLRIESLEAQLTSVNAQMKQAELNIQRAGVKAPFAGRLRKVDVEVGQTVTPGTPLVVLAAVDQRELRISLDGRGAMRWLPFDRNGRQAGWFGRLKPVPVQIRWVEAAEKVSWQGVLDRVAGYDEATRTLTVVVNIEGKSEHQHELVPGMFCQVSISGRQEPAVIRFPRAAVNGEGQVFVVVDGQLRSRSFEILREAGAEILAKASDNGDKNRLADGDMLVLTKLAAPVEGMKVNPVIRRDGLPELK